MKRIKKWLRRAWINFMYMKCPRCGSTFVFADKYNVTTSTALYECDECGNVFTFP